MNSLLISFAEFKLPEWLTFGNAVAALISLISLIAALIKLDNASNDSNKTYKSVADKLTANIALLECIKDTSNTINNNITTVITVFDKVIDALEEQHTSNNNVAAFIFECFNLSNLSDENKLKLKVLYDQLFYKTDAKIIEELRVAKTQTDSILVAKDKLIKELEAKIEQTTKQLNTAQSTIRKSRRISS